MGQELAGKVAIVTGGASGIGRAMAELFVAEGARVMVADINADLGEAVAAELGQAAVFHQADVAQRDQVETMVAQAIDRFGGLHVMCNNAGLPGRPIERFLDEDLQEWDRIFAINVMGATYGCQAAARHMARTGGGSIINTASIAGVMPGFAYIGYRASKAALINLTKSIAIDLAEYGIRVNALAPGAIKTPILDYREPGMTEEDTVRVRAVMDAAMMSYQPLKTQGRPSDVAEAALFLASDRARQITGILLPVEGGITAGDPVNRSALIREGRERVLKEIRAERR